MFFCYYLEVSHVRYLGYTLGTSYQLILPSHLVCHFHCSEGTSLRIINFFLIITYIINILLLPFLQFVWFGIGSFKFRKIHIWWDGQHFIRKLCPCINSFPIKIHKGITTYWMLHQSKQLFDIIPALEPTCALAKIWSYRFKFNRILYFGMHMKVINIITLSYFLWNILAIDLLLLLFFCFIFIFNAK